MPGKIGIILVVLAIEACGVSQTLQTRKAQTPSEVQESALSQLAIAAKMYLRDSAELPLRMDLVMVTINTSGRTIRKEHATGIFNFHGYNPRSDLARWDGQLNRSFFHGHSAMLPALSNSVSAPSFPAFMFLANEVGMAKDFSVDLDEPSADRQFVTARMSPRPGQCMDFKWSSESESPVNLCGTSKFAIQKDDSSLQHFSFDAGRLSIATTMKSFGKCELRSYHAEVEFQKVTLPGDSKPFLVPRHVEVVIETDKGKLDITTGFTPKR